MCRAGTANTGPEKRAGNKGPRWPWQGPQVFAEGKQGSQLAGGGLFCVGLGVRSAPGDGCEVSCEVCLSDSVSLVGALMVCTTNWVLDGIDHLSLCLSLSLVVRQGLMAMISGAPL